MIATASGNANAQIQLAKVLLRQGRYRDGHALVLQAVSSPGLSPDLVVEAAQLLRRFEEPEKLIDVVTRTDWQRSSARLITEAARLASASGGFSLALELLDRADSADRNYPHARYIRGTILMFVGDAEAARHEFEQALLLAPHQPHVHWMLSLLRTKGGANAEATIRELLSGTPEGTDAEAYLAYALHNHLHAAGRFDEAWDALMRGCRAKRRRVPYRRESERELFALLGDVSIPQAPNEFSSDGPNLIFVVGMHRSGTTLIERVLAGHTAIANGGETYAFAAQMRQATDHCGSAVVDSTIVKRSREVDFGEVARGFSRYAQWRASGRPWLTEKLPTNFLNIGFILRAFPDARILHMVRDPMDMCFSNLRTFFGGVASYSYDQLDMADYYYRYRGLMSHWHEMAPGRILDVDYSAFVQDPKGQARRVLEFCSLPYESHVLDVGRTDGVVATASTSDIRAGIRKDRGDVWRSYEKYLQPLVDALQPAYGQHAM